MIRFGCQLENANRQFRMLDYSSNLSDKNESAIVNRKITFPRASIISYASEWQIYHATTRERIAGIAMDIPSGPGKLSRAFCLIVALPTTNEAPSKQNGEMRAENRRKKKSLLAPDSGAKAPGRKEGTR